MATLRALQENRASIVAQMRQVADAADDATGLTPEQQAAFDALKTALVNLENAIAQRQAIEDAERRMQGTPLGSGDAGFDRLAAQVTALDVVRAQMGGTDAASGRAREVSA